MIRRAVIFLILAMAIAVCSAVPATTAAQPPTTGQEQFTPLEKLPPGSEALERLPAAPFLVGAYAFFLVLMMFYVWTVWRRIDKVEREMRALDRRQGGSPR